MNSVNDKLNEFLDADEVDYENDELPEALGEQAPEIGRRDED